MYIEVNSVAEIYKTLGRELLINGEKVYPKGIETKEILAPKIRLLNPKNNLAYNESRKFNLIYALVESLMLFNETKEVKYFSKFNNNIINYSDNGKSLYGAYGKRIAPMIKKIINKLKNDKDSRQAVLSIYNNDFYIDTKDVPCTLSIQFIVRNEKLNAITTMRSNDIIWGLPYDIFMFTNLQQVIANTLNLKLGWYEHNPTSMHVYSNHYNMLKEMSNTCEPIETNNDLDYSSFKYQACKYLLPIVFDDLDNDTSENELENICKMLYDKQELEYLILIMKETMYRRKKYDSIIWNIKTPEWSKKFTKRWKENA